MSVTVSCSGKKAESGTEKPSGESYSLSSFDIKEQVLWETDSVRVTATGVDRSVGSGPGIKAEIENKTDGELRLELEGLVVNDFMMTSLELIDLSAGETVKDTFSLYRSVLQDSKISRVGEIELYLSVRKKGEWEREYSDRLVVSTEHTDWRDDGAEFSGTVLYDDNDIKIVALEVEKTYLFDYGLNLYIENNSEYNITIECEKLFINGIKTDSFDYSIYSRLFAGKKSVDTLIIDNDALDRYDIEAIENLTIDLKICDENKALIDRVKSAEYNVNK